MAAARAFRTFRNRVRRSRALAVMALLGAASLPILAQEPPEPSPPVAVPAPVPAPGPPPAPASPPSDRSDRRLFQRFAEDAVIARGGWLELLYGYDNLNDGSRHSLGPVIAFKVVDNLEGGLRFGILRLSADAGPDGSGLSDVDAWVKFRFGGSDGHLVAGALVKFPAADEEEGLGTGQVDTEAFLSFRADLQAVTLALNAGYRHNGEAGPPVPADEDSMLAGGAVLLPLTARQTFVIEGTWESERLEGAGGDARLTVGLQSIGRGGHGGWRAALAMPLSDAAPDYQVFFGALYAY